MGRQSAKSKNRPRRAPLQRVTGLFISLLLAAACTLTLTIDLGQSAKPAKPAPTDTRMPSPPPVIGELALGAGRGFIGSWWQVYFNEPGRGGDDGIDGPLVNAIAAVRHTLDIAAFEMNSEPIYQAILAAHQRGVRVRIVTDDEHGLGDEKDDALRRLKDAGIPIVDDSRSALMHNKFMIMDRAAVWTGSWNYTVNGTYRNNNNVLALESATAAAAYQAEWDEMFIRREFGPRSTDDGIVRFTENGTDISIIFAPEADAIPALIAEIQQAEHSIRFMVFTFSIDELAHAVLEAAAKPDIRVQGIFEKRNSGASWSQLPPLHCAGVQVRQDGNRYTLHHKVFIIDDTVITGSFNFSNSAANRNDENIVIIRNPDIARQYIDEWQGLWDSAITPRPDEIECD